MCSKVFEVASCKESKLWNQFEWRNANHLIHFAFGVSWHCHVRRQDEWRHESNQDNR